MTWQLGALALGVAGSVIAVPRVPAAFVTAAIATLVVGTGVVPSRVVGEAWHALDEPLAFLLVAVPLAVALDEIGFFRSATALVDGSPCQRGTTPASGCASVRRPWRWQLRFASLRDPARVGRRDR